MNPQELPIQSLDFSEIEQDLKDFLKGQDYFKDYNFEASGLNTIIKILAYNTYHNNLITNISFSEKFLDSAQLRSSIVSRAKELGYRPNSITAAKTTIDLIVEEGGTTLPSSLFLEKGSKFDARDDNNQSITFLTTTSYSANKVGNSFTFSDVELVQGTYGIIDFVKNDEELNQRFILPSKNIDTKYLEVYVQEGSDNTTFEKYSLAESVVDLNNTSKVFFLQEANDELFEVYFGNDILGKSIGHGKIIRVVYLLTEGEIGNGFSSVKFQRTPNINDINDGLSTVVVKYSSRGGSSNEDLESIRFRAPKFFSSLGKAHSTTDYEQIILKNFTDIKSVSAWGGEDDDIPTRSFGKVFLALNSQNNLPITSQRKSEILKEMKKYKMAGTTLDIVDPDFLYIDVTSKVYIKDTLFFNTDSLKKDINTTIQNYSINFLERFNSDFEHSILTNLIDKTNTQVVDNNDTQFSLLYTIIPNFDIYTDIEFKLENQIKPLSFKSTNFTNESVLGYIKDDGNGILKFYNSSNLFVKNVGTIDYETGVIKLNRLLILSNVSNISFSAKTETLNVFVNKNKLLKINSINVSIVS